MVGLLLITHNSIGTALLDTATHMLGMCPLMVSDLPVFPDRDPEAMVQQGRALVRDLNHGDGVLVLSDMYGSTPSNIAARRAAGGRGGGGGGGGRPGRGRGGGGPRRS